jgi:hypothetical protein
MPGVLSEGLFLSNPRELRMLKRARVRQAMANAYYQAIADYLADRGSHVGYRLLSAPTEAVAGGPVGIVLEVRSQGGTALRGWRLDVRAAPAASLASGQPDPRPVLGGARLPTLGPGERRTIELIVTAPAEQGDWVLLVDALDASGAPASRAGSPVLEIPLAVVATLGAPDASPAHSASPPSDAPPPSAAP